MTSMLRKFSAALLLGTCGLLLVPAAQAQPYPSRPIRLIVPWAPGSPGDLVGRVVGQRMSAALGQPITVDNRPGASGTVGMAEVLKQPADGYTLYMLGSPTLMAPLLYPSQQVDIPKALQPVGHVAWGFNVLVTAAASPLASPRDIVAAAATRRDGLTFASAGSGTPAHLAGELFRQRTGTTLSHVPYHQFPMAVTDVISGRVDFMFLTASAAIPQVTGGKLKALAVTSTQRLSALPQTPTMVEQGFPDFSVRGFEMLAVRSDTPRAIVERLNAELNEALRAPQVKERFDSLSLVIDPMSPDQAHSVLVSEQRAWMQVARSLSLKAE